MDQIFFHYKSKDVNVGYGVNEIVANPNIYSELNQISNWRRVLSNLYESKFTFDGLTFSSVEHAFQYSKINLFNKNIAFKFALESNDKISIGDGVIARKNRKIIILNKSEIEKWNKIKSKILEEILLQKFIQNPYAKKILLLTLDANLTHAIRTKPIRQIELENVRKKLC
jgi:predicted NAD-dependent protein-ADP-ribosyltransferase YbiA (DUF1768 family)